MLLKMAASPLACALTDNPALIRLVSQAVLNSQGRLDFRRPHPDHRIQGRQLARGSLGPRSARSLRARYLRAASFRDADLRGAYFGDVDIIGA